MFIHTHGNYKMGELVNIAARRRTGQGSFVLVNVPAGDEKNKKASFRANEDIHSRFPIPSSPEAGRSVVL